ncbi:hypothetical protein BKA62DRAFT_806038 [Auriculariales sp. MPI-PUGE-AT-0066]|nr:hypothetical protein BKA62DRAFT_806038 [Auriculariales sp. MPI-PUGE-AT-0066]
MSGSTKSISSSTTLGAPWYAPYTSPVAESFFKMLDQVAGQLAIRANKELHQDVLKLTKTYDQSEVIGSFDTICKPFMATFKKLYPFLLKCCEKDEIDCNILHFKYGIMRVKRNGAGAGSIKSTFFLHVWDPATTVAPAKNSAPTKKAPRKSTTAAKLKPPSSKRVATPTVSLTSVQVDTPTPDLKTTTVMQKPKRASKLRKNEFLSADQQETMLYKLGGDSKRRVAERANSDTASVSSGAIKQRKLFMPGVSVPRTIVNANARPRIVPLVKRKPAVSTASVEAIRPAPEPAAPTSPLRGVKRQRDDDDVEAHTTPAKRVTRAALSDTKADVPTSLLVLPTGGSTACSSLSSLAPSPSPTLIELTAPEEKDELLDPSVEPLDPSVELLDSSAELLDSAAGDDDVDDEEDLEEVDINAYASVGDDEEDLEEVDINAYASVGDDEKDLEEVDISAYASDGDDEEDMEEVDISAYASDGDD